MEWKKDLYHYQETPPPQIWEQVSAELDTDVPAIREALFDHAEEPPAGVWSSICRELDREIEKAPVIWYRRPVYAGAAAAALAAIVFLSTYLNNEKGVDLSASVYKPAVESLKQQPSRVPGETAPAVNGPTPLSVAPAPFEQPISPVTQTSLPPDGRDLATYSLRDAQVDRNYIYFTTSSGELKRTNYKFERMIADMKKQDSEKMREWREKLAASAFIPTAGNFFDIAEMARLLEER